MNSKFTIFKYVIYIIIVGSSVLPFKISAQSYLKYIWYGYTPTGIVYASDHGFVFSITDTTGWGRLVIKVDSTGTFQNGFSVDSIYINSLTRYYDRGFLMKGSPQGNSHLADTFQNILIKTDSNFNVQWQRCLFDLISGMAGNNVFVCSDSSITITGYNYISKLDNSGNLTWGKKYEFDSLLSVFTKTILTSDNGFLIASVYNGKTCVLKTDENGNILWSEYFNVPYEFIDIKETVDHKYLLLQSKQSFIPQIAVCSVMKIDSSGNFLWEKSYALNQNDLTGHALFALKDKSILISSEDIHQYESVIIHTDSDGAIINANQMNAGAAVYPKEWIETLNGFVYLGETTAGVSFFGHEDFEDSLACSFPVGISTSSLIDTPFTFSTTSIPLGICVPCSSIYRQRVWPIIDYCVPTNITETIRNGDLRIFPNPFSQSCKVFFNDNSLNGKSELILSDILGKCIINKEEEIADGLLNFNPGEINPGIYFFQISINNKQYQLKIIKI